MRKGYPRRAGPPYLPTPVLLAVAMVMSSGNVPRIATATVSGISGPTRATAQRDPAAKWLSTLTEAARRMHGQPPAVIRQSLCPIQVPLLTDLLPRTDRDDVMGVHTVMGLHLLDLPPPASRNTIWSA